MASAPARSAARARSTASAVPYPAGATTGSSTGVSFTAAATTCSTSSNVREKNSPVPPAANSPDDSYCASQAMFWRYAVSSNRRSSVKCVTGKDSNPEPSSRVTSGG